MGTTRNRIPGGFYMKQPGQQGRRTMVFLALFLFLHLLPLSSQAYSVLTHEALVDANWDKSILPALKLKYPAATEDDLKKARSYAYGGAVAPDMGYYPFGSKLFTNLVHYVRSGDFVEELIKDQQSLNDYAFALGFLCHYMADIYGHPLGTNRSVPIVYPEIGKKFGNTVTYAQDKTSHLRMEFGFDVLQTARGDYASAAYHNFIGFSVADTLLGKAFLEIYGLDIHDVFSNFSLAIGTFRWSVKDLFPEITRAGWVMKKKEIKKTKPEARSRDFIYSMHRKQYYSEYGKEHEKTGVFANILSFFVRIMPKVGPLKALKFKTPGPEAEKYFVQSFDTVVYHYALFMNNQMPAKHLTDRDFDTGKKTSFGEYPLCDEAYKDLLMKLKEKNFSTVSPSLKQDIVNFYSATALHNSSVNDNKEIARALEELKGM
ncbi:MAG: zinc dependent phospholipase C family protein [Flavisolibacter sp.]